MAATRHRWIPECRTSLAPICDDPDYADQWAKIAPKRGLLL